MSGLTVQVKGTFHWPVKLRFVTVLLVIRCVVPAVMYDDCNARVPGRLPGAVSLQVTAEEVHQRRFTSTLMMDMIKNTMCLSNHFGSTVKHSNQLRGHTEIALTRCIFNYQSDVGSKQNTVARSEEYKQGGYQGRMMQLGALSGPRWIRKLEALSSCLVC